MFSVNYLSSFLNEFFILIHRHGQHLVLLLAGKHNAFQVGHRMFHFLLLQIACLKCNVSIIFLALFSFHCLIECTAPDIQCHSERKKMDRRGTLALEVLPTWCGQDELLCDTWVWNS